MEISGLEWTITIGVTVAVLLFDVIIIARDPHEPSLRECAVALSVYIGAAVVFGLWIWLGGAYTALALLVALLLPELTGITVAAAPTTAAAAVTLLAGALDYRRRSRA